MTNVNTLLAVKYTVVSSIYPYNYNNIIKTHTLSCVHLCTYKLPFLDFFTCFCQHMKHYYVLYYVLILL